MTDKYGHEVRRFSDNEGRFLGTVRSFYAGLPFETALFYAAAAIQPNGKRNVYQRSLGIRRLRKGIEAAGRMKSDFFVAASFADLLQLTTRIRKSVKGLGSIWAYDAALRIAFHFGETRLPLVVHLSRRSKRGLNQMLGAKCRENEKVALQQFPVTLQSLKPYELEFLFRSTGSGMLKKQPAENLRFDRLTP